MEKKENVKIAVETLKEGIRELIIREGKAEEIIPKIKRIDVVLAGTISAPAEFYGKRMKDFDKGKANITFSKAPENLFICLLTNEHYERPHYKVSGKLELSEDLKLFGIAYKSSQQPKTYTLKELSQLLRFNKMLFANADECNAVIESITKSKIKIDTQTNEDQNSGGTRAKGYSQTVDHGIKVKFLARMPLFKGKEPVPFEVDICLDVKEREVYLWLESPSLATIIKVDATKYIDEELLKMSDLVQIEN